MSRRAGQAAQQTGTQLRRSVSKLFASRRANAYIDLPEPFNIWKIVRGDKVRAHDLLVERREQGAGKFNERERGQKHLHLHGVRRETGWMKGSWRGGKIGSEEITAMLKVVERETGMLMRPEDRARVQGSGSTSVSG